MTQQIQRTLTPEQRELERKRAELEALQYELAHRELELTTLQATLEDFERRYLRIVGAKLARLDELDARIANVLTLLNPQDPATAQRAAQAKAQAEDSAQAWGGGEESAEPASQPFQPGEELKALYRQLAKAVHPDLATDPAERERRTKWMVQVNAAYRAGDESGLQALLAEWQNSPENVTGDGVGAELIRLIRQIAQVQNRLLAVAAELEELRASDLFALHEKAAEAQRNGSDLLVVLAAEVEVQITHKRTQLDALLNEFVQRQRTL